MDESPPTIYEIRVRGVLTEALLGAFPALTGVASGGVTVLSGCLPDQAALHGVLYQIESMALELLEVRRVTHPPDCAGITEIQTAHRGRKVQ